MQILAMLHGAIPFFKQLIFTADGPFFFSSPTAALLLGMLTIASCFSRLICAGFFITDSCKCWRELSIREIIGVNQIRKISGISYKLPSHDSSTKNLYSPKIA